MTFNAARTALDKNILMIVVRIALNFAVPSMLIALTSAARPSRPFAQRLLCGRPRPHRLRGGIATHNGWQFGGTIDE